MHQPVTVRQLRKAACFGQKELADLLDTSQGQLSKIESGEAPEAVHLLGLEIIFGVPPAHLFQQFATALGEDIVRRAAELERTLTKRSVKADRKRAALRAIMNRVTVTPA